MKKLLIICGGKFQIPIVKKAKEMGYFVINSNLYENSPAFKYADSHYVIDVLNWQKNLEVAKKEHVDGVISEQSEISVRTVAKVSEALNLKSISTELSKLYTNKYLMREFCRQNNFFYPKYLKTTDKKKACDFVKRINKKTIMKPLDAMSSRGIYIINTVDDVISNFENCCKNSSDKKSVIIEEYIDGPEFTVDGITINGKHYCLAISEKQHFKHNPSIANRLFFSYSNEKYNYDELRKVCNSIIESSQLKFGLTHSEFKFYNNKFYLIEMAARGGGGNIATDIVPFISGIDNYKYYISSAANDLINFDEMDFLNTIKCSKNKIAVLGFLDFDSKGLPIKEIVGLDFVKKIEGLHKLQINFEIGDIIKHAEDDSSRSVSYILFSDSKEKLLRNEKLIIDSLKIRF